MIKVISCKSLPLKILVMLVKWSYAGNSHKVWNPEASILRSMRDWIIKTRFFPPSPQKNPLKSPWKKLEIWPLKNYLLLKYQMNCTKYKLHDQQVLLNIPSLFLSSFSSLSSSFPVSCLDATLINLWMAFLLILKVIRYFFVNLS